MKKLIEFIKGLFCKKCSIKAEAVIIKPSEEKQEMLDKKENLQKLETENFITNALPNNFNSIYSQISIAKVAGAMEIPQVTKWLLEKNQYAGILVLGCVIKGETSHFEHVSQVAINGIAKLALKFSTPIANGIITAYTEKDAIARISSNGKNLGFKAMEALDAMIHLKNKISYDHS